MPRTKHPRLGRYTPERYGEHPSEVNGTVKKFRKWRKRRVRTQRDSRRKNRVKD